MIFEDVGDGRPHPRLPADRDGWSRVPDGVRFLTLDQAAARFAMPPAALSRDWVSVWGDVPPAPVYQMLYELSLEPAPPANCGKALVADGRKRFTVGQAAELTGLSPQFLRERWVNMWRGALPEPMLDAVLRAEGLPPLAPPTPTIKSRRQAVAEEIRQAMDDKRPRGKGGR